MAGNNPVDDLEPEEDDTAPAPDAGTGKAVRSRSRKFAYPHLYEQAKQFPMPESQASPNAQGVIEKDAQPVEYAEAPAPKAKEDIFSAPPSEEELQEADPVFAPPTKEEIAEAERVPPVFDSAPIKEWFGKNLEAFQKAAVLTPSGSIKGPAAAPSLPADPKTPAHEASGFLESLEAGWQISVSGLLARGQKPDVIMPEDAPAFYRIASQVASLAGDVPAMLAGGMAGAPIGAAAGTAVAPGPGTVLGAAVGAGAGGNALPAGMRKILMDHYEKGDVRDFSDFWERSAATFIETSKAGLVGAVTMGAGSKIKAMGMAAGPITSGATKVLTAKATIAEVATMVTVGKALEGEAPKPQDFLDAALVVGFLHGTTTGAAKLRKIYSETGLKPHEVVAEVNANPVLKQEMLATGDEIPTAFKAMAIEQQQVKGVAGADAIVPEQSGKAGAEAPKPEKPVKPHETMVEPSLVLQEGAGELPSIVDMKAFRGLKNLGEAGAAGADVKPEIKRSEAGKAVVDRIASEPANKSKFTWDDFYTDVVDRLNPIKRLEEAVSQGKPAADGLYQAARMIPGVPRMVEQFYRNSPFEFHSRKNVGKPLAKIIEPFKDDVRGFEGYLVSKRTVELNGRGIETGVPLEAAKAYLKEGAAKYETAAKELQEFQNHALKYLRDSGILSEEGYQAMLEHNKDYIPFNRLMDEGTGKAGAGKGLQVKNPVKEIRGSKRQIVDPIANLIRNTEMYITLAERNRVGQKLVELAEANPEVSKAFVEKVKTPMKAIEVSDSEASALLREHGVDTASHTSPEAFTIFRPQNVNLGREEIAVFRNGKREVYKVSPEVAEAFKQMDEGTANIFVKALAFPARLLRAGTVLTPDFALRNFTRDQISGFSNSKAGLMPFVSSLGVLGELVKKGDIYQGWLKSGGANAEMKGIKDYIDRDIYGLSKETGLIDKTWNVLKTPVDVLAALSQSLEEVTRLAEFKKVMDKSGNIREAGFAAREVTVDMARAGAKTRALNQIIAFWNIGGVQGTDRFVRQMKEKPSATTAKLVAAVTIPSVLLWMANKDDPRWRELPRWQKDMFWIVMTKDHVFRIPKPHLEGLIFGSLVERTMEKFFTDNPKAMKDFSETLLGGLAPGYMPTAVQPLLEHKFNKSFFTGGSIVPHSLEKVLPEYQYNEYTTESAKILGKMVGMVPGARENTFSSPMVLENYVRSWSGNLGMYALKAADQAIYKSGLVPEPVKPLSTLADIPFVKAFVVRYPSASAQSIQDFYDRAAQHEKVRATIKHLAKQGNFEAFQKELALDANQDKFANLTNMRTAIGLQGQLVHKIYQDPSKTPAEKRQLIDNIYNGMIATAQAGNKLVEALEKNTK